MSTKKKTTAKTPAKKAAAKKAVVRKSGVTSIRSRAMELPPGMTREEPGVTGPGATADTPASPGSELLLVCLQDPFDGIGGASSKIVNALVPASDHDPRHQWRLESMLEMNRPRFFESWATRGSFTLDVSVSASVVEAEGHWGGNARTASGSGNCRVMILRDGNKVQFSLASGARHADEMAMPRPDPRRFLNADVGFAANGPNGLTAGAVAVISNRNWSRLIAGSSVATQGMALDGKWRNNLEAGDGDSTSQGNWAFAVMSKDDYSALCRSRGWAEYIEG